MKATSVKLNISLAEGHQEVTQDMLELFITKALKTIDVSGRFCAAMSRCTPGFLFELLGSDFRLLCRKD